MLPCSNIEDFVAGFRFHSRAHGKIKMVNSILSSSKCDIAGTKFWHLFVEILLIGLDFYIKPLKKPIKIFFSGAKNIDHVSITLLLQTHLAAKKIFKP